MNRLRDQDQLRDHYDRLRARGSSVETGLGPLSSSQLRRRFVAVDGQDVVEAALDRPTVVATGVGMTGPPHLGTLGQLYAAIDLQRAGLDVWFVLADLEPYHGGQVPLDRARERARRYRQFAVDLGFDPEQGRLRTQYDTPEVLQTAARLAPYFDREALDPASVEQTAWERAVEAAYDRDGVDGDGPTSEAARTFSAVLHGADFLHPLAAGEYDTVLIAMGADEHRLVDWTRNFLAAAPVDGSVGGIFSRMVPGIDGHPKMGRSLAGSGLTLADDPEALRDRVRSLATGDEADRTVVAEALRLAAPAEPFPVERIDRARSEGGQAWDALTAEYADLLADLAARWQSYEVGRGT